MSPYAAWRCAEGPVTGRLGAGYAFGVGQIAGATRRAGVIPDKVTGPWGSPYGLVAFAFALSDAVELDVRGQVGWVNIPVVGYLDRGKEVDLKGLWTSAQLGFQLTL